MSGEILLHWMFFHLQDEIQRQYGEDAHVILMMDQAGCHPDNLTDLVDNVEVNQLYFHLFHLLLQMYLQLI